MKRRLGRELIWMTLPVVLPGVVGLWCARGGSWKTVSSPPFDLMSGPPRLEAGPWRDAPLLPAEVARGFLLKKRVSVWQGGQPPLSPGAKPAVYVANTDEDVRMIYRRGKKWQLWKPRPGYAIQTFLRGQEEFGGFALRRDIEFKINLDSVPRDADEVRLRGRLVYINAYQGSACGTARPDPRWKFYGKVCQFTTSTKPFDFTIKRAGGPWPSPLVSHRRKVEVLGAAWFVEGVSDTFALHLRHTEKSDWNAKPIATTSRMRLLDGNNHDIAVYENHGAGRWKDLNYFGDLNQGSFSPNKPANEIMLPFMDEDCAPKNGWDSIKRPLWLEGQVDDGECWPTPFKVRIDENPGDPKNYGAPQK